MTDPKTSLWKIQQHRAGKQPKEVGSAKRRGFTIPLPSTSLALAVLGLIAIGIGLFAWQAWPRDPGEHSADAGFLRDMNNHHSQAVSMAVTIRDRTEDPALFNMATEMMLYQSTEMGMMFGLLDAWNLSYTGEDTPMAWMGHPTEGPMPGMATQEEVESLSTLPVDEAEVLFLNLMIRHHQGGVQMAEALLERGDSDEVRSMANRIVVLQDSEIDAMNYMLEQRGLPPITDPLPESHDDH